MEITGTRRGALRALALGVVLTGGSACSSHEGWVYDKPSASPAQIDRDLAACEKLARPRGPLAYPSLSGVDRERFNTCMEAKGYRVSREAAR